MTPTITGRWGKPSEVLLDLVVGEDGTVHGVANPGRQDAKIRRGHFDAATGAVTLEGVHVKPDGTPCPSISKDVSMGGHSDSPINLAIWTA